MLFFCYLFFQMLQQRPIHSNFAKALLVVCHARDKNSFRTWKERERDKPVKRRTTTNSDHHRGKREGKNIWPGGLAQIRPPTEGPTGRRNTHNEEKGRRRRRGLLVPQGLDLLTNEVRKNLPLLFFLFLVLPFLLPPSLSQHLCTMYTPSSPPLPPSFLPYKTALPV